MEDVLDEGFSNLDYVLNILKASISSISYLHHLFPSNYFTVIRMDGIESVMLNPDSCPAAFSLFHYIDHGIADSLSNHFLQTIVFSIFTNINNPSSVLELYTFSISYSDSLDIIFDIFPTNSTSNNLTHFSTKSQFLRSWCSLIRKIICYSHLFPPPSDNFGIQLKLTNNNLTPFEYYPPGFQPFQISRILTSSFENSSQHHEEESFFPESIEFSSNPDDAFSSNGCLNFFAQIIINKNSLISNNNLEGKLQIENDPLFPLVFVCIYESENPSFKFLGDVLPGVNPHRINQFLKAMEEIGLIDKNGPKRRVIRNQINEERYLKMLSNLKFMSIDE